MAGMRQDENGWNEGRNDEFMDFYNLYRPQQQRVGPRRSSTSAPRSVYSFSGSDASSSVSKNSSNIRDKNMALPRHNNQPRKSLSTGRDFKALSLGNSFPVRAQTQYRSNQDDSGFPSSASASSSSYSTNNLRPSQLSSYPGEDSLSRDSGNSSGGTPDSHRRSLFRQNTFPIHHYEEGPVNGDRRHSGKTLVRKPLPDAVLMGSSKDDVVTRYNPDSILLWDFVRGGVKRKMGHYHLGEEDEDEESDEMSHHEMNNDHRRPSMMPLAKRPRTPDLSMEDTETTNQIEKQKLDFWMFLKYLVRIVVLVLFASVIIITILVCHFTIKNLQCSYGRSQKVDQDLIRQELNANLFGQELAKTEILQSLESFLKTAEKDEGKPVLVMIFAGWIGSGKTHTANLIAGAFPSLANKHHIVGSYLTESTLAYMADLESQLLRSCGFNLVIFDDIDGGDGAMLTRLEKLAVNLSSKQDHYENRSNGTLIILTTNIGGRNINSYMMDVAKDSLDQIQKVTTKKLMGVLQQNEVEVPLQRFLSDYNIPVVVVPFLPLTRDNVRLCIQAALRRNGASMSVEQVNSVLEQIQFFSKNFPIFSSTGCKRVSSKVNLALGDVNSEL